MDYKKMLQKIDQLCVERGITKAKAFIDSGAGKNFAFNITSNSSIPSIDKVAALADYFGVSVDYLLGRSESTGGIVMQDSGDMGINISGDVGNNSANISVNISKADPDALKLLEMIQSLDIVERARLIVEIANKKNTSG